MKTEIFETFSNFLNRKDKDLNGVSPQFAKEHPDFEKITVEMVINNLHKNINNAKKILHGMIKNIPDKRNCGCQHALKNAIITDRKLITAKVKKDLNIIIGKYVK